MAHPIPPSAPSLGCLVWQERERGVALLKHQHWSGAELMDQHFDPVVLRLIGLLKKALPHASEENIFWGYHFVSGALMLTLARTGRIDKLSGGLCKSDDYAAVKSRMAQFMAAGFQKICGPAPDTKD